MADKDKTIVNKYEIPFEVTVMEKGDDAIVMAKSETKDETGRVWSTIASGKGRGIESAIDDLQADIARKPMQIAGIIRRMVASIPPTAQEPDAQEIIGNKQQQKDIAEAKELKNLIKVHGLTNLKFPFGATRDVRRRMILEAIDAKTGKKKEAF